MSLLQNNEFVQKKLEIQKIFVSRKCMKINIHKESLSGQTGQSKIYECTQRNFKARYDSTLRQHTQNIYEGVRYM